MHPVVTNCALAAANAPARIAAAVARKRLKQEWGGRQVRLSLLFLTVLPKSYGMNE